MSERAVEIERAVGIETATTPKEIITYWGMVYRWDGGDATAEAAEDADILIALLEKKGFAITARASSPDAERIRREALKALKPFRDQIEAIECTTDHPYSDDDTWPVDEDQFVKIGDLRRAREIYCALQSPDQREGCCPK